MNTLMMQMRHTAHELRVTLDHVLHGGEVAVAPQNSDEAISFLTEPEAEMRAVHHIPEVSAPARWILGAFFMQLSGQNHQFVNILYS